MISRQHSALPIMFLWLMAVAACSQLGIAPAQTFNQKLAYAIGVHTSVLQATTAAVTSGALSSSDGQAVLTQADNAKSILDAANVANLAGDLTGATNKLALATQALTMLQSYLNTHTAGAH
jgi:hypothetical protein